MVVVVVVVVAGYRLLRLSDGRDLFSVATALVGSMTEMENQGQPPAPPWFWGGAAPISGEIKSHCPSGEYVYSEDRRLIVCLYGVF